MGLESKNDKFEDVLKEEYLDREIDIDDLLSKDGETASPAEEPKQDKETICSENREEKSEELAEEAFSEEDLTQRPQENELISNQGIVGNQYDEIPPVAASEEDEEGTDPFAGKESVTVVYGFTPQEVKKALQIFQKYMIYKKNLIYSLIICVLFFFYLMKIMNQQNADKFSVFMCVIIVSALAFIWYFPLAHIRGVVKSVEKMEYKEEFILNVYDNAVTVGEGTSKNVFLFRDGKLKVWENQELFVIGQGKERVFAVPKRCVTGGKEECRKISSLFQNGLGQNYRYIG